MRGLRQAATPPRLVMAMAWQGGQGIISSLFLCLGSGLLVLHWTRLSIQWGFFSPVLFFTHKFCILLLVHVPSFVFFSISLSTYSVNTRK